nr:uncharacterized protein LOC106691067 [Halyomorpha halys]
MDGTGINILGISIKEEVTDETETKGISDLGISIKEEMTNETIQSNFSTNPTINIKEEERLLIYDGMNLGISIKEEVTDEAEPNVPTINIKEEERLDINYGGHDHVKQEGELLVPDDGENYSCYYNL